MNMKSINGKTIARFGTTIAVLNEIGKLNARSG